jgi:hypothetical protein
MLWQINIRYLPRLNIKPDLNHLTTVWRVNIKNNCQYVGLRLWVKDGPDSICILVKQITRRFQRLIR